MWPLSALCIWNPVLCGAIHLAEFLNVSSSVSEGLYSHVIHSAHQIYKAMVCSQLWVAISSTRSCSSFFFNLQDTSCNRYFVIVRLLGLGLTNFWGDDKLCFHNSLGKSNRQHCVSYFEPVDFYTVNMEECCSMVGENDFTKLEILLRLLFQIISCRDIIWEWKNPCWLVLSRVKKIFFLSLQLRRGNYFEYMSLGGNR